MSSFIQRNAKYLFYLSTIAVAVVVATLGLYDKNTARKEVSATSVAGNILGESVYAGVTDHGDTGAGDASGSGAGDAGDGSGDGDDDGI